VFGGQISIDVEESELENPPAIGSMFLLIGTMGFSRYNGAVSLRAFSKKLISPSLGSLSPEYQTMFMAGFMIRGVGVIEHRSQTTMGRQTFLKATLKWQGGLYEFKQLEPETYHRVPSPGKYVRFELGLRIREERSREGQTVLLQFPALHSIKAEEIATAAPPPKPTAPPPAGAKV
jgi:hypothetical protein